MNDPEAVDEPPPPVLVSYRQKVWDLYRIAVIAGRLLEAIPDVQSLGLHMDNDSVRIAVGLCLGLPSRYRPTLAVVVERKLTIYRCSWFELAKEWKGTLLPCCS